MGRLFPQLGVFLLAVVVPTYCSAQGDEAAGKQEERQALLDRSLAYMRRLALRRPDGEGAEFKLIERPVLVFGDPTRSNENGTLWTWGEKGRPVAFLELYQITTLKNRWVHAVTLTAAHRAVLRNQGVDWHPETTHIEPTTMPGGKSPSAEDNVRLRQMKEIARRFTAHEFWDPNNSRFELRLLEKPLHRYQDKDGEIQDGAAFALANGTNPEVILLIEALGKSMDEAKWHYALARLGSAEMHAEIDGKEVWNCEVAGAGRFGRPSEPYWAFLSPAEGAP